MVDIVNKICNELVSYPHVIGIVINCRHFKDLTIETTSNNKLIDLCIVSKETGNQKTLYTESGYFVSLHWYTQATFTEMVKEHSETIEDRTILYDKIGFLKNTFQQVLKK